MTVEADAIEAAIVKVLDDMKDGFDAVITRKCSKMEHIVAREEYIDYLNAEISKYIAKVVVMEMSESDSERISSYYKIVGNLERIGDHAMNIAEYAYAIEKGEVLLSDHAIEETGEMKTLTDFTLTCIKCGHEKDGKEVLKQTAQNEQKIDDMSETMRNNQIKRMKEGRCSAEAGILFSEMVTDFERIGDHALNIAEQYGEI